MIIGGSHPYQSPSTLGSKYPGPGKIGKRYKAVPECDVCWPFSTLRTIYPP